MNEVQHAFSCQLFAPELGFPSLCQVFSKGTHGKTYNTLNIMIWLMIHIICTYYNMNTYLGIQLIVLCKNAIFLQYLIIKVQASPSLFHFKIDFNKTFA